MTQNVWLNEFFNDPPTNPYLGGNAILAFTSKIYKSWIYGSFVIDFYFMRVYVGVRGIKTMKLF